MRREDLLIFLALALVVVAGGTGMQAMQDWFNGDWAEVADCRQTYWTCETGVAGKSRIPRTHPVVFKSHAKACDEYRAYDTALRRASFDCSMSRSVIGGSCKELETDCTLPEQAY